MDIINDFFTQKFEATVNKSLQELSYQFPKDEVINYAKEIISIPVVDFLKWIDLHSFYTLDSNDMPQISSFEDAFYNIVFKLRNNGDKGFRFIEMGIFLQNDGIERNDIANRKYGENHAKTAAYLGYLYSLKYHYYVSCFGYVLEELSEDERKELFIRLLIRTNLFKAIYLNSKEESVKLYELFDFLSNKTYIRRLPGIKLILSQLLNCKGYDFSELINKIEFK